MGEPVSALTSGHAAPSVACVVGGQERPFGGGLSAALDRMISVSEANNRGLSRLVADAESGHEWVILRGSRPAAGMVRLDAFRALEDLSQAERTDVSFFLGLMRYVAESAGARPLLEAEVAERRGPNLMRVSIGETAYREFEALDPKDRQVVAIALRHLAADPAAGTRCADELTEGETVEIRLLEFGPFWVTYAWRADWMGSARGPCVVEVSRPASRGRFERLREALQLLLSNSAPAQQDITPPQSAPACVERRYPAPVVTAAAFPY